MWKLVAIMIFAVTLTSCDQNYHFLRMDGTLHIRYNAGQIEGLVLQNDKKNKKLLVFDEKNLPLLESYLKQFDSFINDLFLYRTENPEVVKANSIINKDNVDTVMFERFESSFHNFVLGDLGRKDPMEKRSQGERDAAKRKIIVNIGKLKRVYEIELNDEKNGEAYSYLFFTDKAIDWASLNPLFHSGLGEVPDALCFWYSINDGIIKFDHMTFDF